MIPRGAGIAAPDGSRIMTRVMFCSTVALTLALGESGSVAEPASSPPRAATRAAPRRSSTAKPRPRPRRGAPAGLASRTLTPGEYGGVTPGLPNLPKIRLPRNAGARCYLTWTGFQLLPTGSRIFLQFNRPPAHLTSATGQAMTVTFAGCFLAEANHSRVLDLGYFPTPLRSARVRRHGNGVALDLQLRSQATASVSATTLQGWAYVFVEFHHAHDAFVAAPPRRPPPRRATRGPRRPPPGPVAP
jgi:hypothetical protein